MDWPMALRSLRLTITECHWIDDGDRFLFPASSLQRHRATPLLHFARLDKLHVYSLMAMRALLSVVVRGLREMSTSNGQARLVRKGMAVCIIS